MLPSWTESLHLQLANGQLHATATQFGRSRWREQMALAETSADMALSTLTARSPLPKRWTLQLGGWLALYGVAAWQGSRAREAEWQAAACQHLSARYGVVADDYVIGVQEQAYGRARPYWAVSRATLADWQAVAQRRQANLYSLSSLLLTQLASVQGQLHRDGLVLVLEPGLVHIGQREDGQWHDLSTRALDFITPITVLALLQEEQRLRLLPHGTVQVLAPFQPDLTFADMAPLHLPARDRLVGGPLRAKRV